MKLRGRGDSGILRDARARAIDEDFDADRRRVGERVAVLFRWLFLIVLLILNNLTTVTAASTRISVNLVLALWCVMNIFVMVFLVRGYRPGKQFSLATMALDIFFAAALVYLSDGFSSPYFLALFLAVITNAVRFGATASIVSAVAVSFIYLFIGGSFTAASFSADPNARLSAIGKVFLFLVVAMTTGYMTRELERERRLAVERAAQADRLRELGLSMVADTDIKDVFKVVVEQAVRMTGVDLGRLVLVAEDGFTVVATQETQVPLKGELPSPDPVDEDMLSKVARSGETEFVSERTGMVVPIASGDGVTALLCLSESKRALTNQDLFTVNALSGSSAVALANALHFHRTKQEATTDGLTGLYNVREFRRRLDAAFARPDRRIVPISLVLVDFDHFKSVNDQVGHQRGDTVLKEGARIVSAAARSHDVVARYGGDELVVIATDANADGAQLVADRIVESVRANAITTTPGQHLTFSIGAATYPADALTATELIAAADQALYLAKREGKNCVRTFRQLVSSLESDRDRLAATLIEAGPQVVVAVAHAVDHRTPLARGHSSRVAAIAEAIAKRSGFPSKQLEDLRTAAFLHDVGHMQLSGADGELEAPGHAEAGERLVAQAPFPAEVAAAVRHHHERWDGTGKPDGLAGDQIPPVARILGIAESFEAMTAGRNRARLTASDAMAAVTVESAHAFDPDLVEALKRTLQDGSLELLSPEVVTIPTSFSIPTIPKV